jgi:hypothetical protein
VPPGDIDWAGSFADAAANLPSSYKFGFAVTEQIDVNTLLARLAWQCWCRFFWEAGKAKLCRIKDYGTPDKSVNTTTDSLITPQRRLDVNFTQGGLEDIFNKIELSYNLDPTLGGWSTPKAYQGVSKGSDATSITKYKTRFKELLAFAIGDNSAMADDLRGKFLDRHAQSRKTFSFPAWLKNAELERGDLVELTCTQLGLTAKPCGSRLRSSGGKRQKRPEIIFYAVAPDDFF